MPNPNLSTLVALGTVVLGLALCLLSLLMVLPVGVNLPASWFGVVLIVAIACGGVALVYRGGRKLWTKERAT